MKVAHNKLLLPIVRRNPPEVPMIRGLETSSDISTAQSRFEAAFQRYLQEKCPVEIGYRGGSAERTVIWISALNLWAHFGTPPSEKGPPSRYWNVFGIGKPQGIVSIACEINPPTQARNYRPAGVFASDPEGSLLVLHRGRFTVTGGMPSSFVRKNFKADWISFLDRGRKAEAIRVTRVPSDDFGLNVRDFVLEVVRIKELARRWPRQ